MNEKPTDESDQLKQILAGQAPPYDPDQSLNRVLAQAKRHTATRDVLGFFVSWIWLLFAGFGASMHQAYVKKTLQNKPNHQQGE